MAAIVYPPAMDEALETSFGAWEDRDLDGEEYVDQLRTGLGERVAVQV